MVGPRCIAGQVFDPDLQYSGGGLPGIVIHNGGKVDSRFLPRMVLRSENKLAKILLFGISKHLITHGYSPWVLHESRRVSDPQEE